MPNWPALLIAPSVALANASIAYALVTPSCSSQDINPLHAVSLVCLLLCLALTWPALVNWLRGRASPSLASDAVASRAHFLAQVAAMTGALSALVVLAEWMPLWIVSPCAA
jgi:hypothetical protein